VGTVTYRQEDADGTLRELIVPWWWPLYAGVLRIEILLTGAPIDSDRIYRMTARHGRWRITPRYLR